MLDTNTLGTHINELNAIVNPNRNLTQAIVDELGGIAVFHVVADAMSKGLPLDSFGCFKSHVYTKELFTTFKDEIMSALLERASIEEISPRNYIFKLCHKHSFSYASIIEFYDVLLGNIELDTKNGMTPIRVDIASHYILTDVATGIIEGYNELNAVVF